MGASLTLNPAHKFPLVLFSETRAKNQENAQKKRSSEWSRQSRLGFGQECSGSYVVKLMVVLVKRVHRRPVKQVMLPERVGVGKQHGDEDLDGVHDVRERKVEGCFLNRWSERRVDAATGLREWPRRQAGDHVHAHLSERTTQRGKP